MKRISKSSHGRNIDLNRIYNKVKGSSVSGFPLLFLRYTLIQLNALQFHYDWFSGIFNRLGWLGRTDTNAIGSINDGDMESLVRLDAFE